jgi:hypothetical protein
MAVPDGGCEAASECEHERAGDEDDVLRRRQARRSVEAVDGAHADGAILIVHRLGGHRVGDPLARPRLELGPVLGVVSEVVEFGHFCAFRMTNVIELRVGRHEKLLDMKLRRRL